MRKYLMTLLVDTGIITHANESIVCGDHKGIVANDPITFISNLDKKVQNNVKAKFESAESLREVRELWGQITKGYAKHLNKLVTF